MKNSAGRKKGDGALPGWADNIRGSEPAAFTII
jgi:hypothetical protein